MTFVEGALIKVIPYFSFTMLCYNKWEISCNAITSLVESINQELKEKGIEIVVIDNGSTDNTPLAIQTLKKELETEFISFQYVRLQENMGYTVGVNIGLSYCRGTFIGIVNNDLQFPKNWLNPIYDLFQHDLEVGLCAPYLSYATGLQHVGVSFDSFDSMNQYAQKFMEEHRNQNHVVQRAIGACMIFKKEVLDLLGGNDFWYGIGNYDDDDLCIRTMIAGYKIMVVGGSFVHHIGHSSFNQTPGHLHASFWSNRNKYKLKWNFSGEMDSNSNFIIPDSVRNRPYCKESDFIPVRLTDFDSNSPLNGNQVKQEEKYLLVADWSNYLSKWKATLMKTWLDDQECEIWIPENYFITNEIQSQIDSLVSMAKHIGVEPRVSINREPIPPIQLLNFISRYKGIKKVPNDFVNKYFVYLAESVRLSVI